MKNWRWYALLVILVAASAVTTSFHARSGRNHRSHPHSSGRRHIHDDLRQLLRLRAGNMKMTIVVE